MNDFKQALDKDKMNANIGIQNTEYLNKKSELLDRTRPIVKKENAEKYLEMFCEKNNTGKDYLLQWMPIVAASYTQKCTD